MKFETVRPRSTCVRLSLLGAALTLANTPVLATDYYVSNRGNDRFAGTSSGQPWKTISRVNSAHFLPGDRILFWGGQSFAGKIYLAPGTSGTATNPIIFTSYGSTPAIINGGSGSAFYAYNVQGISISNLQFIGSGANRNSQHGVFFYADLSGGVKLNTINIDHVEVSGFGQDGIVIGAWNGSTGFTNVNISYTSSHDNGNGGIQMWGATPVSGSYPHSNVYIGHCLAFNNTGIPTVTQNSTGNGIVIAEVQGGTIERSVAYNNGANNIASAGPVGIWTYDSDHITIQYNESHHNHTNSGTDGDGFDLDGGVTNSVLQYNYSHDNDGAGYLICEYAGQIPPNSNNVVRYNISQNDARRVTIGALYFWNGGNGIQNIEVYNNTVFVSPAINPTAVTLQMPTTNVHFRNNIFITTGGVPLIQAAAGQNGILFQGNLFWASGGPLGISWGGTGFSDLPSWRAATGQEQIGSTPVGISHDPILANLGLAPTLNNADLLSSLNAYRPQTGSPVIDTGLNLTAWFAINPGSVDFYGTSIPRGAGYDVGAVEY
jgi:hypothetical protein